MRSATLIAACVLAGGAARSATPEVTTRKKLFADHPGGILNPLRYWHELDLTGDGIDELILSESVSCGGTGGFVYNLYLGLPGGRFKRVGGFGCNVMAVETHGSMKRLWTYSHSSSASGSLQYRYFDDKGAYREGPAIVIFPGDGGTQIGNAILASIFNSKTRLKMVELRPPSNPRMEADAGTPDEGEGRETE
ncbi:MAG: hypothetical protein ACYTFI_13960 [Planctomycetota bacterium]